MDIKKIDDKPMVIHTKKKSSLHIRGAGNMPYVRGLGELGANAMADQIEGGNEIRDAAYIAHTILTPAEDMAKASFKYSKEAMEKAGREYIKRKIKKQDISKKLVKDRIKKVIKKTAQKTASDTVKETSKEATKEVARTAATISAQIAAEAAAEVTTEVI